MNQWKLNRGTLSSYFISVLFTTLLFKQSFFFDWIRSTREFLSDFITRMLNVRASDWGTYISLVLICFFVVILVKMLIVDPIKFYIEDESGVNSWEILLFFIMVFGSFIYYINDFFKIAMPADVPKIVRVWLGDSSVVESVSDLQFASAFWSIGPLLVLFLIIRGKKAAGGGDSSGGDHH
jgi:hypothetical protein